MSHSTSILGLLLIGASLAIGPVQAVCADGPAASPRHAEGPATPAEAGEPSRQAVLSFDILRTVLGETSPRPNGVRYLVSEIRCTNASDEARTVSLSNVRLRIGGESLEAQFRPDSLEGFAFDAGEESLRFRDLEQSRDLTIEPGESQTAWFIFSDLLGAGDVPKMTLDIANNGAQQQINLNDVHEQRLELAHERIGPRGVLSLLTISGALDTVNVGSLVETMNQMANQGTSRMVVTFDDSAKPLPDMLALWLEQVAQQRDQSRLEARFPALSPTIREVHIARLPGYEPTVEAYQGRPYRHLTTAAAVEWALRPVFQVLPAEDVVDQIERGHPLARAAALATGGRQLSQNELPLILRLAESEDKLLKRGALLALREFGHPAAIDSLVENAKSESSEMATLAVECLAASRFEAAHSALEPLLDANLRVPLVAWGRILARFPRARWIEPLRKLASGEWTDTAASANEQTIARREALIALERIGHPELVNLLGKALAADQQPLRQTAFTLLMNRTDDASERLAVDYALKTSRETFPNQQVLSLFERVRDPRAVPLLVAHLDAAEADKSLLIKTLSQIGPGNIDQTLAAHYDGMQPREKATVIAALADLDSPLAFDLAKQGASSDDNVVFHPSVRALQEQGSPAAVAVLAEVLLETSHSSKANSIVRALEGIGTLDAINVLRRARYAGDDRTEQLILRRLVDITLRSPGAQFLSVANEFAQQQQWQEAVDAYSSALELDPELTEAQSGRGHCHLHLEQLEPAGDDFRKSLRSNPYDSLAVTGLAIVLVRQGHLDEGLKLVEEASDRFPHDMLYAYNSACVYGRAIEAVTGESKPGEPDPRAEDLRHKALEQLRLSVERGFDEFDFMKRDPDLAPLRDLDEFQQLESIAAPKPQDKSR